MGKVGVEFLGRLWFKFYISKFRYFVGEFFLVFIGIW